MFTVIEATTTALGRLLPHSPTVSPMQPVKSKTNGNQRPLSGHSARQLPLP
jgi:hypothetical protein